MRWLAIAILLTACTGAPYENLTLYLNKRGITEPTAQQFQTCRAFGCQIIDLIEPTKQEWRAIESPFRKKAKSAEAERKQIAASIAKFEQVVGNINGTSEDVWGTFQKGGRKQLDCVDESTNTSIYLSVLQQRGNIKFHEVGPPTSRVPILSPVSWPHQTAVFTEKETGESFAIDSWFHDNGETPEILPLKTWKRGWKPEREEHTEE